MEATIKRIHGEIFAAEKNFNHCISTLKEYITKWSAIQKSFSDFNSDLSQFNEFPDLQSRLELAQLSACDSIIAEMSRELVLFDHMLTNNRAAFSKAKKLFESKPLSEAWTFPPEETFLPDLILEASKLLDTTFGKVESRKLAIFKLTNKEEDINVESLERLINSIS